MWVSLSDCELTFILAQCIQRSQKWSESAEDQRMSEIPFCQNSCIIYALEFNALIFRSAHIYHICVIYTRERVALAEHTHTHIMQTVLQKGSLTNKTNLAHLLEVLLDSLQSALFETAVQSRDGRIQLWAGESGFSHCSTGSWCWTNALLIEAEQVCWPGVQLKPKPESRRREPRVGRLTSTTILK